MAKTSDNMQNLRVNSIVEGTKLRGEIISPGNFRIDGEVDGNMKIEGKLIIGSKGLVKGKVVCKDAEIEGKFDGELSVNGLLSLKSTSQISGDAIFERLMVAEGAKLTCTCNLKQNTGEQTMKKAAEAIASVTSKEAGSQRKADMTASRL
ncbi:MAG: polymer-forming cytoskeletal protein [Flavobacteriales bacterium]|nr:polymer-forming cytoskeletal protein [Flavobacteriales bacterium]